MILLDKSRDPPRTKLDVLREQVQVARHEFLHAKAAHNRAVDALIAEVAEETKRNQIAMMQMSRMEEIKAEDASPNPYLFDPKAERPPAVTPRSALLSMILERPTPDEYVWRQWPPGTLQFTRAAIDNGAEEWEAQELRQLRANVEHAKRKGEEELAKDIGYICDALENEAVPLEDRIQLCIGTMRNWRYASASFLSKRFHKFLMKNYEALKPRTAVTGQEN